MSSRNLRPLVALACLLGACASSPTGPVRQDLRIAMSGGIQPVSDVEGPYGAVSVKKHAVALRIWPDGLADGFADVSIIVTNESWNTIRVSVADMVLESRDQSIPLLGRREMLASVDAAPDDPGAPTAGGVDQRSERLSSRTARSQEGAGAGSRIGGDVGVTMVDPAIADAARRVGAATGRETADAEARRQAIESWYMDTLEIYPGDTAVGGVGFKLPGESRDLALKISVDGEVHEFRLGYSRATRNR